MKCQHCGSDNTLCHWSEDHRKPPPCRANDIPLHGVYTAMRHPELFEACDDGSNHHDMRPYRIWWCFGLAWGERCTKCSYKNAFAYD